ncbi:PAS domain-containing protein [Aspergillus karnatakaensis]|uniref:GATA transcription factor LreA n=1 Tax=Aspergillus karnatakaensis TaxID=1810916 RepID=UPI003CCCA5A5
MANRGIDDFDEVFYDGQYSASQPGRQNNGQNAQMPSYTPSMSMGNYGYPTQHPMLDYDPTADTSLSVGAFPYDLPAYPASTTALSHNLGDLASLQAQVLTPGHGSVSRAQDPVAGMYWAQPHDIGGIGSSAHSAFSRPPVSSRATEISSGHALPREQTQDAQRAPQASAPGSSHRFIQPKKSLPVKSAASSVKQEGAGESTPYPNIYSSSGFDMMGILAQVVSRPDPKINLGPVDLSCAFVLCDLSLEDHPIVYVSDAFERLTGYNDKDIVGRNCRFLQSPDGEVEKSAPRKFTDSYTAWRLLEAINELSEMQASIINYRKGGQPFMNLVTMIPVQWDSKDYCVGFQVDLVERPEAVTKRNIDGTYLIDYHRSQLPSYVVPPLDSYEDDNDPATHFSSNQVSVTLDHLARGQPVPRNHLHHVLVENTDDVVFVVSFEGEFLYLSPSCRSVLEYKSSDLVGKTLSTICHPSDIGHVTRDLRACTSNDPISVIYRIRRKESGFAWFENYGGWHITDRGRQFMVLVGRIIPVYSTNQLANIERGGLAENDLWAKLSLSGIILFMSSKCRAVLGRAADDLLGKCIQDIIVTDHSQESGTGQALEIARNGQQTTFAHKVRHRKGHIFPARTTLYPGDTPKGATKPNFLVAQLRFPKQQPTGDQRQPQGQGSGDTGLIDPTINTNQSQLTPSTSHHPKPHPNFPQPFTSSSATVTSFPPHGSGTSTTNTVTGASTPSPAHHFEELNPTRGSSWHFELRELERQNRGLADEVQRLLARRKKRKRKQSAIMVEKSCSMCQTRTTPEWRRGPSGNRDLCNSCGLRWAKQVKNAALAGKEREMESMG